MCEKKGNDENENRPSKPKMKGMWFLVPAFIESIRKDATTQLCYNEKIRVSFVKQTSPLHNRSVEWGRWVQDVQGCQTY